MRLAAVLILAVLAAAPAHAQQPAADPIDVLLRPPPKDVDVEEPDTAATGSAVEPDPTLPSGPQAYRPYVPPPHPTLTAPVFVNETGKNPDAPPSPTEAAYDSRLRSSAASVQGFQGPLDGGWTLAAAGRPLYAFELTDRNGLVEGAWRDLRRTGALDASGFFEIVERSGGDLTFRLTDTVVAVLHPMGGGWSGELTEAGRRETVSLARRAP
ncbi:MAG: hypothetical protein KKE02_00130 [Alphaproteobacteria bacterium]|nr:hypothetical protein [Alphaproteobacteria bacterium]MBU1514852.1 hypothetical protein [Alphaproteobacteria bacterium]MBU2093773.1 hypothetical protein [Alphaproteobacteria bacterium]MBU2149394.1 hypothetical protein [Alphaproteobacteria bacterium]MBU2305354.1 hypothetical protein [Alphaproteobacteria bacterium]